MKRGRKPNPDNVKSAEQPVPVLGHSEPPSHLCDVGKAVFSRMVTILQEMNVFTLADEDLVAQYAEWYALGIKHNPNTKDAVVELGTNGSRAVSPDYTVWRDSKNACQKILNDLGMSPASRTRVAAVVKKEVDELTEFLKRRNEKKD